MGLPFSPVQWKKEALNTGVRDIMVRGMVLVKEEKYYATRYHFQ